MRQLICMVFFLALLCPVAFSQDVLVDSFEDYPSEVDMDAVWQYSKAGGEDGLFVFLNDSNNPPEGSTCLEMLVDMPAKWWYNRIQRDIEDAPLDLTQFQAVSFWFYGDSTVNEGDLVVACFLFDSQNRVLRFNLPTQTVVNSSWQKLTLAIDSFVNEQWDTGYGTDHPDADSADIVDVGFMCVGNVDNVLATLYVDEIRFVGALSSSSVQGTIVEGENPMPDVIVHAIGQSSVEVTRTDENGQYVFPDLVQGRSYRILPQKKGYAFEPGVVSETLLDAEYTFDFTGMPSMYDDLDSTEISDAFDESGLNPDIMYRGVAEWNNPGDERPVIDVTQEKTYIVGFPDAEQVEAFLPAIEPNPLEGASSPRFAVEVGVSYAWDMLVFGQNTNRNYYVEADVYCEIRDDITSGYDRVSLGVRCNASDPANPVLDAAGDTIPYMSSGGYALSYETDYAQVIARKYADSNDTAHAVNRLEGFAEEYGTVNIDESGWHRFRIECVEDTITFIVDGNEIASVTDEENPWGPAALHYRACFPDIPADLQNMHHARFDNLKAGPTQATAVKNWMVK